MNEIFEWIGTNYGGIVLVIVAMVSVVVECLKIPYKKLTAKIKNENHRKLANKVIILAAFGLAYLFEYLASIALPDTVTYSSLLGFIEGCLSNLVYALSEGLITTTQAKKAAEDVKTASADGKITADEVKTVKDDVTKK